MSRDSTGTEVFEEIDPDPDAVLADCGVDTPEDLVDAGGAHDPVPDAAVDADDTTAAELFADLAGVVDGDSAGSADESEARRDDDGTDQTDGSDPDHDLGAFEFVGDSDVVVRDDGDVIETSAADLSALEASGTPGPATVPATGIDEDARGDADRTDTGDSSGSLAVRSGFDDEVELVGPEPTSRRISNDAFSRAEIDVC